MAEYRSPNQMAPFVGREELNTAISEIPDYDRVLVVASLDLGKAFMPDGVNPDVFIAFVRLADTMPLYTIKMENDAMLLIRKRSRKELEDKALTRIAVNRYYDELAAEKSGHPLAPLRPWPDDQDDSESSELHRDDNPTCAGPGIKCTCDE